jgi:2-keto-3-deoxy-L-rhamnonate aldolase RhmA
MRTSKVKQIWKDGGLAIGTLVKSIDPVHSEALSRMGFDFLWYDLKHSDKSVETFSNLARATRVGDVDILARKTNQTFSPQTIGYSHSMQL